MKTYYKGRDVLVTGAGGFLGAALVRRLADLGARVAALHRPGSDLGRLDGIPTSIRRVPVDLVDTDDLKRWTRTHPPRVVFHVAAYGVDPRDQNGDRAFQSNIRGFVSLIDALGGLGVEAFVNTGTCSEYRGGVARPLAETDPIEPRGIYAETKAAAVRMGVMLARQHGWPIVTLRPFTFYGPRERPDRLIPFAIRSILRSEEIRMTGGKQERDFIHVDDVVEAYLQAGRTPVAAGEIFNIGSGRATTVRAAVERIRDLAGSSAVLKLGAIPYRPNELWHLCADIGEARKRLKWTPKIGLEEGLRRTLEWERSMTRS
ncbi:MAG TPA: NAD-dependent epimerase/dehydratase family protein [Planctomycetota bacterium]|nr:NAD-dependent epimerase/dehydratase family protein [Planctomycetota bacterium]